MRVGMVGMGFIGGVHLDCYEKMANNGKEATLVAICDVDEVKLGGKGTTGNLGDAAKQRDLSMYKLYNDMEEMIKNENLDFVDLCLPTHLHAPMAVRAMELGVNVFCEKPMARNVEQCDEMIAASKKYDKKLMIGHCLRYWDTYQFAKKYTEDGTFGKVTGAYFYRGGSTPKWSWQNWLLTDECSGGCLLDQHVHDIDTVVWMFGLPQSVSATGRNIFPGSGFDIVSANYIYENGPVVNAQDDWTINGAGYGFEMLYRINFEKGAIIFEKGKTSVYPEGGEPDVIKFDGRNAYYDELVLFTKLLKGEVDFDHMKLLESHRDSIRLAIAEEKSAKNNGAVTQV